MIPFVCIQCGHKLEVPEEYAGQQIRCPTCATVGIVVLGRPARAGPAVSPEEAHKVDDAAAALEAKFHPRAPSEKAAPGAGGSKQYDLIGISREAAEGHEAAKPEAAPKAEAEASEGAAPPAAETAAPGEKPEAAAPAEPDSAETAPLVAMPAETGRLAAGAAGGAAALGARPPAYLGVTIMGVVLAVCGVLSGLAGLALAGYHVAAAFETGDWREALAASEPGFALAAGLVILGIILVGLGPLFFCIRDLARNSFHRRKT